MHSRLWLFCTQYVWGFELQQLLLLARQAPGTVCGCVTLCCRWHRHNPRRRDYGGCDKHHVSLGTVGGIHKRECLLSYLGHVYRVTQDFFSNVLFGSISLSSAHLLDVHFQISRLCQLIYSPTPQGVCVQTVDVDAIFIWIFQHVPCRFYCFPRVAIRHVILLSVNPLCRQVRVVISVFLDVAILPSQGSSRTHVRVSIYFMKYTHIFHPFFWLPIFSVKPSAVMIQLSFVFLSNRRNCLCLASLKNVTSFILNCSVCFALFLYFLTVYYSARSK